VHDQRPERAADSRDGVVLAVNVLAGQARCGQPGAARVECWPMPGARAVYGLVSQFSGSDAHLGSAYQGS
jgi:hypothetical protein